MTAGKRRTDEWVEHAAERDERQVGDHDVDRTTDEFRGDVANVEPFEHRHLRVFPDTRMQLSMTDIDRSHEQSAALQQTVGEATGGGTSVERSPTVDRQTERVERSVELLATAAHEPRALTHDHDSIAGVHLPRRLVGERAIHEDAPSIDGDRRLHSALDEATSNEVGVETLSPRHRSGLLGRSLLRRSLLGRSLGSSLLRGGLCSSLGLHGGSSFFPLLTRIVRVNTNLVRFKRDHKRIFPVIPIEDSDR